MRVTGFHNQTPLIEFLSKGAHFANITGEKLSEYHVTQSMGDVLRDLDLNLTSYSVAPCWPDDEERAARLRPVRGARRSAKRDGGRGAGARNWTSGCAS